MALTKAKLEELIEAGDIVIPGGGGGGGLSNYPIGAIYQSTVSTSPATLFGGTWAAVGGRMLIGADETYAAGSTGGEATHTLTTAELASHQHSIMTPGSIRLYQTYGNEGNGAVAGYTGHKGKEEYTATSSGGGAAHNNMPPYYAVYMWRRTA